MRWILCGKNDAAAAALEMLVERGDEVLVVAAAGDDGRNGWQRSLRGTAERLGLRVEQPRRINAAPFVRDLADFDADALLSIQYDQILKAPLFEALACPCLNFHFALLPRHRGVQPVAWAILSGDAEAGVSLHHMVEAIDAGDVLAQRTVPIDPAGTARELYDALSRACIALFGDAYPFPVELLERRLVQDPARACYHRAGDIDFSQRRTDWRRPAPELQRWLRAMIFPPFQHPETRWRGRDLRIERVAAGVGAAVDAEPGRVVSRSGASVEVAAGGGTIRILSLGDDGSGSAPLPESLRVGDRLA